MTKKSQGNIENLHPDPKHNSGIDFDLRQTQVWLELLAGLKKAGDESTGKLRAEIKRILDQSGYHAKAFAVLRSIDGMSPTQRADFLRTFKPGFDAFFETWDIEGRDLLDGADEVAGGAVVK